MSAAVVKLVLKTVADRRKWEKKFNEEIIVPTLEAMVSRSQLISMLL